MVASRTMGLTVAAMLVLAGCSGDGNGDDPPADSAAAVDKQPDAGDDTAEEDAAADSDDAAAAEDDDAATGAGGGQGQGTATITLANGDVLTTDVFCNLEPEVVGDTEFQYSATSMRSPYFDVSVFTRNDGPLEATVQWEETEDFATFTASWLAGDIYGAPVDVALDGTTITASATFLRGDDGSGAEGEQVEGEVVVECG